MIEDEKSPSEDSTDATSDADTPVRMSTQVVEVVEEEEEKKAAEENATSDPETPDTAKDDGEEDPPEESETIEEQQEAEEEEDTHEKQEEVVKDLFKKKEAAMDEEITVHDTKKPKTMIIWIAVILVAVFLIGGGIVSVAGGSLPSISLGADPTPTPEPTPLPSPTPEPVDVDISELSVQVLNGSGVAGAAGAMQEVLEDLGYTVDDTGNADNYDFEETEVYGKQVYETILAKLAANLGDDYTVGVIDTDLDEDSSYDIQVIVGAE